MSIKIDQRFGKLRVTRIDKSGKATCSCDCGKACTISAKELRTGVRTACDACKPTKQNHGFTAAQIAKGQLEPLGKRIAVHLEKMRGYEAKAQEKAGVELRKADDHWNSVSQLLAEAKAKCDSGGFKAFQSKYCPDLGRSRIYELLAIGSGKKTIEASRAATRGRVKKHRAVSVTSTVTDKKEVAKKVWAESAQAMAAARDRQAVQANDDVEARAKLDTQPAAPAVTTQTAPSKPPLQWISDGEPWTGDMEATDLLAHAADGKEFEIRQYRILGSGKPHLLVRVTIGEKLKTLQQAIDIAEAYNADPNALLPPKPGKAKPADKGDKKETGAEAPAPRPELTPEDSAAERKAQHAAAETTALTVAPNLVIDQDGRLSVPERLEPPKQKVKRGGKTAAENLEIPDFLLRANDGAATT